MKPIHKFNNGQGATLCHKCNCIISLGHTDDLYCKECKQETPEEELLTNIKFVLSFNNNAQAIRFIDQYGDWKQEQMYSEEDMMFAYEQGARLALISQSPLARHKGEFPTPKEWFEQFKKK